MKGMDKTISLILAKVKPPKGKGIAVGVGGPMGHEEEPSDDLEMIAEELIAAVKEGNTKGVVEALRGAFLTLDSEPHVEGEHLDEESEEEEEGEEEGPEHEASESAGEEAGEKYGRKEDLFKKYFGGGSARYAEGGTVEDGDRLDLSGMTRGDKKTFDKITQNKELMNHFRHQNAMAVLPEDRDALKKSINSPDSDFWKMRGPASANRDFITDIADKLHKKKSQTTNASDEGQMKNRRSLR